MPVRTALALFSGGLDSILACRVVAAQGILVVAVKFVTPFFDYELLADPAAYQKKIFSKYGIEVFVEDLSPGYLELLHHPCHGFGRHFNPCVDCKILMLTRAKKMMAELDASFLVTGEVLGQRPMSQRRSTLRVIERDSGSDRMLLRPLSAKLLKVTEAEEKGWVDRGKLLDFNGRGRNRQIALAREFGITDFPVPSGGCILADLNLSPRISRIYQGNYMVKAEEITVEDVRLLLFGRQFRLPGGGWLILGRNQEENALLSSLAQVEDAVLAVGVRPGPTAILRRAAICYADDSCLQSDLRLAASLVVRFGRQRKNGPAETNVFFSLGLKTSVLKVSPMADLVFQDWVLNEGQVANPH